MSSREHALQNAIRNALCDEGMFFRAQVGQAWTGEVTRVSAKRIIIDNPRPFSTGLPPGFSDLFGEVEVVITPEMVGTTLAVFTVVEVKDKGKLTEKQQSFINAVKRAGGRGGVARSVEDALRIVRGEN